MTREQPEAAERCESFFDSVFSRVGYVFNYVFRGSFRRRFTQDFAEHVRLIVERKLPLAEGIERLGETERSLGVRYGIQLIADSIRAGVPFHEALARHSPALFPPDCVSMIRAGELSGRLPEALGGVVEDLTFHRDVKVRFAITCIYLGLLFLCLFLIGSSILTFVLPRFVELYDISGTELPASTKDLINGVRGHGGYVFAGILVGFPVVVLFVFFLSRLEVGMSEIVASVLPGVRGAYAGHQRGRFLSALGMYLAARVPVEEAVAGAAEVSRHRSIRRLVRRAGATLREGVPLSGVLGESRVFDEGILWRIRSAERRGDLPETLRTLGVEEQEAAHRRWVFFLSLFRPASIIMIAILEFLFVRATYEPLFRIMDLVLMEYI